MEKVEKVVAYVDGFNMYYGMLEEFGRKYMWLDLPALCTTMLRPGQQLVGVKYFTARVRQPADSQMRQNTYLDALDVAPTTEIIYGRLQHNAITCKNCSCTWQKREEKKTDVAIAAHMVADAHRGTFDMAMLFSGDSDLVPPVEIVKAMSNRRVVAAFPPKRKSRDLRRAAGASVDVSRAALAKSQLPQSVALGNGTKAVRPSTWR